MDDAKTLSHLFHTNQVPANTHKELIHNLLQLSRVCVCVGFLPLSRKDRSFSPCSPHIQGVSTSFFPCSRVWGKESSFSPCSSHFQKNTNFSPCSPHIQGGHLPMLLPRGGKKWVNTSFSPCSPHFQEGVVNTNFSPCSPHFQGGGGQHKLLSHFLTCRNSHRAGQWALQT